METAGAEDDLIPDAEVAKEPLKLTPEILKRDRRKTDIVEINLRDGAARVVEKSKAPKLTKKALREKAAPIQTAEFLLDGETLEIGIQHGKPMLLDLLHAEILNRYETGDLSDPAVLSERETEIKHLLLSEMIPNPVFSRKGDPADGEPIEEISQILLNGLWQAYTEINHPIQDDWYQVKVLRGVPLDTLNMIGKNLEMFPTSGYLDENDLTPDEYEAISEAYDQQRLIVVSSMILDPSFSLNGAGTGKHPYPIEDISEKVLQTLNNAYRVVNVPEAGYDALRRFPGTGGHGQREECDLGSAADG